jgi:hypothetical protein
VAHEITQFIRYFLTIVRLISRYARVHRILGQECKVLIWVAAMNHPLHFEVGHEALIAFFVLVVVELSETLEALRLVVRVWLTYHSGDPLDDVLFLISENKNYVFHCHESMAELGLSHFSG